MTRTELIIQLLKVAIALAFGAYFVWWSLRVLDRLTPEYEVQHVAGRGVMDVNAGFRTPRGSQPDHGYAAMRHSAMAAFAKSWRRE
jgi:hypothetical protein